MDGKRATISDCCDDAALTGETGGAWPTPEVGWVQSLLPCITFRPVKSHGVCVNLQTQKMMYDLQVSRQCYKISLNVGNFIFYFCVTRIAFCVNPRGFLCESERSRSQGSEMSA